MRDRASDTLATLAVPVSLRAAGGEWRVRAERWHERVVGLPSHRHGAAQPVQHDGDGLGWIAEHDLRACERRTHALQTETCELMTGAAAREECVARGGISVSAIAIAAALLSSAASAAPASGVVPTDAMSEDREVSSVSAFADPPHAQKKMRHAAAVSRDNQRGRAVRLDLRELLMCGPREGSGRCLPRAVLTCLERGMISSREER